MTSDAINEGVPIEIWELVVDHFRFQPQMLKILAVISKGCTRRARFHLFRTIILRNNRQYRRLLPVLYSNPQVSDAVRRLFLDGSESTSERQTETISTPESWVDSALEHLQTMLKHVEAFRISYPPRPERYLPYHLLQPGFPQLTELVFAECAFFHAENLAEILRTHLNLRRLTISGVSVDRAGLLTGVAPPLPLLQYLEVDCSAIAAVTLARDIITLSGSLPDVRVVRLDNVNQNEEFAVSVLNALSSSLSHVRIHIARFGYQLYDSRVLQKMKNLSSLMIDMSVHVREFLYSFAAHIRSPSFSTLIIRHRFLTGPRTIENEPWLMLGETLRGSVFADLRKLQWVVQTTVDTQEMESSIRAKLNMPALNPVICCISEQEFTWERP